MKKTAKGILRDKQGFSLMELMIVISIFTILAAVTYGRISNGAPMHRLNAAARYLLGDMRFAASLASRDDQQYAIRFTGTQTYDVVQTNPLLIIRQRNNVIEGRPKVQWAVPALMPVFESNGTITSWNGLGNFNLAAPNPVVLTSVGTPNLQTRTVTAFSFGRTQIAIP